MGAAIDMELDNTLAALDSTSHLITIYEEEKLHTMFYDNDGA